MTQEVEEKTCLHLEIPQMAKYPPIQHSAPRLAPPKSSLYSTVYPYSKGQVMEKLHRWKKDETPDTNLIQEWRNLVF